MSVSRFSQRFWMTLALAVLAVLVFVDAFVVETVISGSFAVAAVLAATAVGVRGTASVAGLAVGCSALAGLWNDNVGTSEWAIRGMLSAGLAGLAVLSASIRTRREAELRRMTVVAETAQRALLR